MDQGSTFPGDTPEFYYLNAGETDGQTNYNTSYEWAMLSYLGRINYTFRDRYLLTASFRADGSPASERTTVMAIFLPLRWAGILRMSHLCLQSLVQPIEIACQLGADR
ncbi:MAG: hypothetical protein H6561_11450 [Lewinellaceae bacterium]|nr:hypothetical protein [Lewinellaceae bacterium]